MNKLPAIMIALGVALGLLIAACAPIPTPPPPTPAPPTSPPPTPPGMTCESLDSLVPKTQITVLAPPPGNSFQPPSMDLAAHPFTWGNGTMTPDGFAEVDDQGRAGGSGYDVEVNNVLLSVSIGAGQALQQLQLTFGEYGGNLNLSVNNQLVNFNDFVNIAGTVIAGVKVDLLYISPSNDLGQILFQGPMMDQAAGLGQFSVGGQELWIDDICFST